jgi:hypothetical protein
MSDQFTNAYNLLSKNIDFITEECTMWMESQYPNQKIRSKKEVGYSKCSRDLNFIINALISDLKENSDNNIVRVANTYWLQDKRQLFSIEIELAVYEKMIDIVTNYVFKNIIYPSIQTPYIVPSKPTETVMPQVQVIDTEFTVEDHANQKIIDLIGLIVNVLKNGKDKLRSDYDPVLELQKDSMDMIRRCQRNWNYKKTIPQKHIDHWAHLLKNSPSPIDEAFFDVYIITNRSIIKELFYESWGYVRCNNRLSRNTQVDAPLLFVFKSKLPGTHRTHYFDGSEKENTLFEKAIRDTYASIGMASGLIAYSAAMLGYSTGFNRCMGYLGPSQKRKWYSTLGLDMDECQKNHEEMIFSLGVGYPDTSLAYNETHDNQLLMEAGSDFYHWEKESDIIPNVLPHNRRMIKWHVDKQEYSSKRVNDKDIKINIIK